MQYMISTRRTRTMWDSRNSSAEDGKKNATTVHEVFRNPVLFSGVRPKSGKEGNTVAHLTVKPFSGRGNFTFHFIHLSTPIRRLTTMSFHLFLSSAAIFTLS